MLLYILGFLLMQNVGLKVDIDVFMCNIIQYVDDADAILKR
jgi:hypothetical protein